MDDDQAAATAAVASTSSVVLKDEDPLDTFTDFNVAQSVAKMCENMGFGAATADALELISGMTKRYFEDLCTRTSLSTSHARRQIPTLSDVNQAFKAQNVSLSELYDYMLQVEHLPSPPPMPEYPVRQCEMEDFRTRILLADPFADEIPSVEDVERIYSKKVAEDEVEEPSPMDVGRSEEAPIAEPSTSQLEPDEEPIDLWSIPTNGTEPMPSFVGMSASQLGFDMELYEQKRLEQELQANDDANALLVTDENLETATAPSAGSAPHTIKMKGLNSLVEKIKKRKNKEKKRLKDKERKKDRERSKDRHHKHREKKHRDPALLAAPTLSPPAPLSQPDSGLGDDSAKSSQIVADSKLSREKKEAESARPMQIKEEPQVAAVERPPIVIKIPSPPKPTITPPPKLEQITDAAADIPPSLIAPIEEPQVQPLKIALGAPAESKRRDKRHKKEKKREKRRKREEKSRKRRHEQISAATPPPLLEPSVIAAPSTSDATAIPSKEESPPPPRPEAKPTEAATPVDDEDQSKSVDLPKAPTPPTGAPVRLKIRIGNTPSIESVRSSPTEAQKTTPVQTTSPPLPVTSADQPPASTEMPEKTRIESAPLVATDSTEPPRKKHKTSKKEKRDKERARLVMTGADGQTLINADDNGERHKKRSKEHKEKKRKKHKEERPPVEATPVTSEEPGLAEEKPKSIEPAATLNEAPKNEPLKLKFSKNSSDRRASDEVVGDQVKESMPPPTKESHEKKVDDGEKDKPEKSHKKHKKHKKEKKHKRDRESPSRHGDRPTSSSSSHHNFSGEKPAKQDQPRPSSQADKPSDLPTSKAEAPKDLPTTSKKDAKVDAAPKRKESEVKKEKPVKASSIPPTKPPNQRPSSSSSLTTVTKSSQAKPTSKGKGAQKKSSKAQTEEPALFSTNDEPLAEDEGVWVCPKCSVAYVDGQADMVGCDLCDQWYHFQCVGLKNEPAEDEPWYCPICLKKPKGKKKR